MKHRFVLTAVLTVLCAFGTALRAQGTPDLRPSDVAGIPTITCTLTTDADSLFFRGNDYVPNQLTVTITVTNTSASDTAKQVTANMVADTRFNIVGAPVRPVIDFLLPGASAQITFQLRIASERSTDGQDTIRTLITTINGAFAECNHPVWVEHEYFPDYSLLCSRMFGTIVFDDNINDYSPNPFRLKVDLTNVGDGESDSTLVQYLGTRGISVDPNGSSIQFLGFVGSQQNRSVEFSLQALKRTNDTTVTVCLQIQGKGGYKRKTYIDSCCVDVFIPLAKQAVYDVQCDIVPDEIKFENHKYTPDPFEYRVNVRNIGTALGKNVRAQLILPPAFQLDAGETIVKPLGDLITGSSGSVSWFLKPVKTTVRDTVQLCVRVFDDFENSATCCDSVIVDSIRQAVFNVYCEGPDTLRIDPSIGGYTPDIFPVRFVVTNVGSDYADSVKATIIIQTPDVNSTEVPFLATKEKLVLSGTDTLEINSSFEFTWLLKSLRRAISGPVTIKFTVQAENAESKECEITIYIPALEAPDISLSCEISPPVLDVSLNGYQPSEFIYRLNIWNPGGSAADSVYATIVVPPGLTLKTGETQTKFVRERLAPNDTVAVIWILVPIERRIDSLGVTISANVTAVNLEGRFTLNSDCSIMIPLLPFTSALVLPQDPVGYYGGRDIEVPIYIDDPERKLITNFDFEILYNVNGSGNPLVVLDGNGNPVLDGSGNPIPEPIVNFIDAAPCNPNIPSAQRPLTCGWTISAVKVNDNLLRVTARTTGGPLSYPALAPGQPAPPLMVLLFRPVFGASPNHLEWRTSFLMWPIGPTAVRDRVRINNGLIRAIVTDGLITVAGDCLRPLAASERYVLSQNKPNPFNPMTTIEYGLPEATSVKITVHDPLGRLVTTLVDDYKTAGTYTASFNATGLPSGVYFYRMETPGFSQVMKMVVAK